METNILDMGGGSKRGACRRETRKDGNDISDIVLGGTVRLRLLREKKAQMNLR
jgi:hypothetical protein